VPTKPSGRQAHLVAHEQQLVVVEVGGGVRSYQAKGVDVLDGFEEDQMCPSGNGQLLAPWPNRLGDGCFTWNHKTYQTAITEVSKSNAIHGLLRWANWTLPEPETLHSPWTPGTPAEHLSVSHRLHPQPGWPWAIDFRVAYRLGAEGLEVRTWATNLSEEACPIGIGWHPYIRAFGGVVDDIILKVPARTAYLCDDRGLPTGATAVGDVGLDFTMGRPIGPLHLDTAFTDLDRSTDGRAVVEMVSPDGTKVRLWMSKEFTHLMIYSGDTISDESRRRRSLAVEPMTAAPDMLRSGDGRLVLGPGDTLEAAWGIQVA
jgi:aldose 1-epimerase